jgi:hypothetical protein
MFYSSIINGVGYRGEAVFYYNGTRDLELTLIPSGAQVQLSGVNQDELFKKFKEELTRQGVYYQNKTAAEVVDCFTVNGASNPLSLFSTKEEKINFLDFLRRYIPAEDTTHHRILNNILNALNKGK